MSKKYEVINKNQLFFHFMEDSKGALLRKWRKFDRTKKKVPNKPGSIKSCIFINFLKLYLKNPTYVQIKARLVLISHKKNFPNEFIHVVFLSNRRYVFHDFDHIATAPK